MSWRCSGVRCSALDFPPFRPPARRLLGGRLLDSLMMSSTSPVAMPTMSLASWFGSRGRFGAMWLSCHIPRLCATARQGQTETLPSDGLLDKAVEQLPPAVRLAPVEPEGELVQITSQMLDAHRSLMRAQ
jgi:hypothetical protein